MNTVKRYWTNIANLLPQMQIITCMPLLRIIIPVVHLYIQSENFLGLILVDKPLGVQPYYTHYKNVIVCSVVSRKSKIPPARRAKKLALFKKFIPMSDKPWSALEEYIIKHSFLYIYIFLWFWSVGC